MHTTHLKRKIEVLVTPILKLDRGRGTSLISSTAVYTVEQMTCNMIDFLVESFVYFVKLLQSLGTNCPPLLANLFLCLYESEFLDSLVKSGLGKIARSFNVYHRYDDLIVFNNKNL